MQEHDFALVLIQNSVKINKPLDKVIPDWCDHYSNLYIMIVSYIKWMPVCSLIWE